MDLLSIKRLQEQFAFALKNTGGWADWVGECLPAAPFDRRRDWRLVKPESLNSRSVFTTTQLTLPNPVFDIKPVLHWRQAVDEVHLQPEYWNDVSRDLMRRLALEAANDINAEMQVLIDTTLPESRKLSKPDLSQETYAYFCRNKSLYGSRLVLPDPREWAIGQIVRSTRAIVNYGLPGGKMYVLAPYIMITGFNINSYWGNGFELVGVSGVSSERLKMVNAPIESLDTSILFVHESAIDIACTLPGMQEAGEWSGVSVLLDFWINYGVRINDMYNIYRMPVDIPKWIYG